MRGGYRVLSATSRATSRARLFTMETIPLARGSTAFVLWTELLEAARYIMRHHDGVPLAPVTEFPSHADGAILSQTDASGYDGFGGFVWLPGDPTTVHWVSEPWPPEIKQARTASDMRRTTRAAQSTRHPLVSMPVAELWAAWMVPRAVMDQLEPTPLEGEQRLKIIAILDCQPTVHALNRATGGEPNMNLSLHAARKLTRFWLAVHVRKHRRCPPLSGRILRGLVTTRYLVLKVYTRFRIVETSMQHPMDPPMDFQTELLTASYIPIRGRDPTT